MRLELQSVLAYGIPKSLDVLNLGFSDYIVKIQMDLPHFYSMLQTSNIDVNLSQVVLRNGRAIGIALIARRGWNSRLAGMAIIPDERGKKVGKWLMKELVNQAGARGDRRLELEVIAQNEPAVALYQKMGFQTMRRLVSYRLEKPTGQKADLSEVDIRQVSNLVNLYGISNLPWQLSGETLTMTSPPHRAYKLDSAYAVITDPERENIIFRSLLTLPESRRSGQAKLLIQALFARFSEKNWIVPAIFPEEISPFFENLGFERQELSQFQMELALR